MKHSEACLHLVAGAAQGHFAPWAGHTGPTYHAYATQHSQVCNPHNSLLWSSQCKYQNNLTFFFLLKIWRCREWTHLFTHMSKLTSGISENRRIHELKSNESKVVLNCTRMARPTHSGKADVPTNTASQSVTIFSSGNASVKIISE